MCPHTIFSDVSSLGSEKTLSLALNSYVNRRFYLSQLLKIAIKMHITVPIDLPGEQMTYSSPLRNQQSSFRSSSFTVHDHIPDFS